MIQEIIIESESIKGQFYKISFDTDLQIAINCTCPAGNYGKICKHRKNQNKIGLTINEVKEL